MKNVYERKDISSKDSMHKRLLKTGRKEEYILQNGKTVDIEKYKETLKDYKNLEDNQIQRKKNPENKLKLKIR
nr:2252_t:CDS:2 [Entrophospora candida]CAG8642839.1 12795_t:CDS:2 [Entrophospora candida]